MDSWINSFYVGEYTRQMDEKMRVAMPARWRPEDSESSFLALPNPLGCLTVYPPKMVARLEEKVAQVSLGDTAGQMALAKLFSKADIFTCDSKGRVKLEERLLRFAQISTEAVFVGGGAVFNIWSPERFQNYIQNESLDDVTDVLKGLGL